VTNQRWLMCLRFLAVFLALAGAPLPSSAQSVAGKVPRVGLLGVTSAAGYARQVEAMRAREATALGPTRRASPAVGKAVRSVHPNEQLGRARNEAISLYAFGFLQRERRPGALFHDATQIGIEVGAADAKRKGPRSQTRKDLVLWRRPGTNRWYPPGSRNDPWAIMEWKVRRTGFRSGSSNAKDINGSRTTARTIPRRSATLCG
jgi:hypothetical protein